MVDWPPCRSTAAEFAAALRQYAAGVCLLTVRDGIDDVGTTVSSVMSVSADPPLVAVGLAADGYPAEVLEEVGRCGLTVLAAEHAIVASRFSSAGRPSARHLLESVPWTRAPAQRGDRAGRRRWPRWTAGWTGWSRPATTCWPCCRSRRCRCSTAGGRPLLRLRGRYVDETGHAAAGRA